MHKGPCGTPGLPLLRPAEAWSTTRPAPGQAQRSMQALTCRWRLQMVQVELPTAPLGARGCNRRRRKKTLLPLIVYVWMPPMSVSLKMSWTLTTSW